MQRKNHFLYSNMELAMKSTGEKIRNAKGKKKKTLYLYLEQMTKTFSDVAQEKKKKKKKKKD